MNVIVYHSQSTIITKCDKIMTNSMILEKLSSLGPSREYVALMVKGKENIFPYLNFVCCHIVLL